jgi:hypothetical protein
MVELAFALQRELLVVVHGGRPPTQTRWEEFCRECRRFVWQADRAGARRMFIVSDGGGPGVLQRAQWLNAVERTQIRTAVVSPSQGVWQIHGALQLFNAEASCFAPVELKLALAHLGLVPRQFGELAGLLDGLAQLVSGAGTARELALELSEEHRRQQMKSDSGIRGREPVRLRASFLERFRRGA